MTFLAPLFLVAALAGVIPVLLHMMNRQQAPVLPFSTLRFLQLSVQRTRRRKVLHDVLLLTLRVAALVLIALGLAQPTLSRFSDLLGRKAESAVVLILDNSASMGTADAGGKRWESAQKAAEQLLDQLGDSDSVAMLLTCGPPRPELDRLHTNHDVVRSALDAARCQSERADLAARLHRADQLLAEAQALNKEIYVVTDMQAVSWQSLPPPPEDANRRSPIVLIDVHTEPAPNAAVTQLGLHSAGPVVGVPLQLTVRVNGDPLVEQQRHVELLLNDQSLETSPTLKLAAGGTADATFRFQVDRPGVQRGVVRLVGRDANELDDQRFFTLTVEPQIPVAVIKARRQEIPYLDDTYYLERVLAPVTEGGWAIRTTALTADELDLESLAKYAVVFCVNLPALKASTARWLLDYVKRGGHVVWTCGDEVDPAQYSAMNAAANYELLPLPLGTMREAGAEHPDGWHIGSLDATHEALTALTEPNSLYRSVLVSRHIEIVRTAGSDARVLATLDDGQPLLVERRVGAGSVLLLGTSVHVDWCNLPLRPLFLPLVARLTFYLANAHTTPPLLVAGAPLVVPISQDSGAGIEVHRPTGETVRVTAAANETSVRYADTHDVGVYEIKPLSPGQTRHVGVAANLDSEECDPAFLSADEFHHRLGIRPWLRCTDPANLADTMRRLREGESVMEPLLIAVLIALVAEACVANWRVAREQRQVPHGPSNRGRHEALPDRFESPVLYR